MWACVLDDLPPQTLRLLGFIQKMEEEKGRNPWRRRDIREYTGWSDTALKVHLGRLAQLEFVLTRRDPSHAQGTVYELLFDGDSATAQPHLSGLLDVIELRRAANGEAEQNRSGFEADRSGQNGNRSAPGQPPVRGWSGLGKLTFSL